MAKRSIQLIFAALSWGIVVAGPAQANCPAPNAISNGQPADAAQLMANFAAMGNCAVSTTGASSTGSLAAFSGPKSVTTGNLTGDVTTSGSTATTLSPSGVTAGTYNNANITVDAKGRITAAASGGSGIGSDMVLLETLMPNAVGSVNSEAWAGGPYRAIMFDFELVFSDNGVTLAGRIKQNGEYKATAAYRHASSQISSSANGHTTSANGTATEIPFGGTGGIWGHANAATVSYAGTSGQIWLERPNGVTLSKNIRHDIAYVAVGSSTRVASNGAGAWDGADRTTPAQGFQLFASSGTMTGTINVYGIR